MAQTRIRPPVVEGLAEGSEANVTRSTLRTNADIEAPVPVALGPGMPYIHVLSYMKQTKGTDDSLGTQTDLQLTVGMLHHANEGAPWWKLESGRLGCLSCQGYWLNRGAFNLEKAFPVLRPNNSDKLDAWIGLSTVTGHKFKTFFLPEIGWKLTSTDHWLFEFNAPHLARVGFVDREWLGALAWRQDIRPVVRKSEIGKIEWERTQYLLAQAGRELSMGLDLLLSAGVRFPKTAAVSIQLSWSPRD